MENKSSQSSLLIGIVIALLVAAVAGDMIYRSVFGDGEGTPSTSEAVSYTHLTLPTICSV